jgi:hypothetical protein
MSHPPLIRKVRFAPSSRTRHIGLLALTSLLLVGPAIATSAQNLRVARALPERHFTVPPDVPTAVVLQTEPDAACDVHAAGVNDPSQTMKVYANSEGYLRFHFTPLPDIQDAYLQLDCTAAGAVTAYPVHLRVDAFPTEDMPAPERSIPAPAGSTIRPALTDEAAQQLSDEEIMAQGYPPRPNATESPDAYAKWLHGVSQPMTVFPPHAVTRSDITHGAQGGTQGVTEGPSDGTNDHWSGFVAQGSKYSFRAVEGEWTVPFIHGSGQPDCYSSVWVGLDGLPNKNDVGPGADDVVQAGSEQDAAKMINNGILTNFFVWTEVWPQQPTANQVASIFPGDLIVVYVYVGDSQGNVDPSGDYAWFTMQNQTEWQEYSTPPTKLGKNFGFAGTSAEWIIERPIVGGVFLELSDYSFLEMDGAYVLPKTGAPLTGMIPYSKAATVRLTMYQDYDPPFLYDNNVLSTVTEDKYCSSCMVFNGQNFH